MDQNFILYLVIIFLIFLMLMIILLFKQLKNNYLNQFKLELKDELSNSLKNSENLFNDRINNTNEKILRSLNDFNLNMVKTLNDEFLNINEKNSKSIIDIKNSFINSLDKNYNLTNETMGVLNTRLSNLSKEQEKMNILTEEIKDFKAIFIDRKARGNFGELELYDLMISTFGENSNRFLTQHKLSNNKIVDCLLRLPSGDMIAIDAKFPYENIKELFFNKEATLNKRKITADLQKHINDISSKYIIENETADVAFMFIPSEAIYIEIFNNHYNIIEYAYGKSVFLVSPSSLMLYLTLVRSLYNKASERENVKEILHIQKNIANLIIKYNKQISDIRKIFYKLSEKLEEADDLIPKIENQLMKIERIKDGFNYEINNE